MKWHELLSSFAFWFHGLLGAAIGGAAGAVASMVADPQNYNLAEGLPNLIRVAVISGIIGAAFYLKKSPIPPIPKEEEEEK